ncbi:MAG: exonuclease domain-containing protein, partial [Rhodospirillales bacterium]
SFLIRPPRPDIWYTHVHGLTWDDVKDAPPFAEHMDFLRDFWAGADALAAHNAGFDRRVLFACCDSAGLMPPALPWICTVKLARACWNIRPTRLPDVCRHLAIPLNHHDAGSDAAACAQVVADALSDGFGLDGALLG